MSQLPDIKLGRVAFYNAMPERHCGIEYVRFFISSGAIISEELIENSGRPVMVDRRTWDEMARPLLDEKERVLIDELRAELAANDYGWEGGNADILAVLDKLLGGGR